MTTIKELINLENVTKSDLKKGLFSRIELGENWTENEFNFLFEWFRKRSKNKFKVQFLITPALCVFYIK